MPSIKEKPEKSKGLVQYLQNEWLFAGVCLVLVVVVIFGSFKLAAILKTQKAFAVQVAESSFPTNLSGKEGSYVASKAGKSYYFPWCGMVNRIKDANLVWFPNRTSAEAFGYKPASNCNGLK